MQCHQRNLLMNIHVIIAMLSWIKSPDKYSWLQCNAVIKEISRWIYMTSMQCCLSQRINLLMNIYNFNAMLSLNKSDKYSWLQCNATIKEISWWIFLTSMQMSSSRKSPDEYLCCQYNTSSQNLMISIAMLLWNKPPDEYSWIQFNAIIKEISWWIFIMSLHHHQNLLMNIHDFNCNAVME